MHCACSSVSHRYFLPRQLAGCLSSTNVTDRLSFSVAAARLPLAAIACPFLLLPWGSFSLPPIFFFFCILSCFTPRTKSPCVDGISAAGPLQDVRVRLSIPNLTLKVAQFHCDFTIPFPSSAPIRSISLCACRPPCVFRFLYVDRTAEGTLPFRCQCCANYLFLFSGFLSESFFFVVEVQCVVFPLSSKSLLTIYPLPIFSHRCVSLCHAMAALNTTLNTIPNLPILMPGPGKCIVSDVSACAV